MEEDRRPAEYPQYLMWINGERRFLSLREAGIVYDSGYDQIEIAGEVMESDGKIRSITDEERRRISEIADRVSSSK